MLCGNYKLPEYVLTVQITISEKDILGTSRNTLNSPDHTTCAFLNALIEEKYTYTITYVFIQNILSPKKLHLIYYQTRHIYFIYIISY